MMVRKLAGSLIFLILLALYSKTVVTEPGTADSGELIASSAVMGIPHPTGYPVYNLLSNTAMRWILLGTKAERVSYLSAILTALASVLLFLWGTRNFSMLSSALIALTLGLSQTIWSQSSNQEVYPLHLFFLCLQLLSFDVYQDKRDTRSFWLFAFVMGLSIVHHLLAALTIPAYLMLLLWKQQLRHVFHRDFLGTSAAFFMLGISPLIYLVIRSAANCAIQWIPIQKLDQLMYHALGRQFHPIMFQLDWTSVIQNIRNFAEWFVSQWPFEMLLLMMAGSILLSIKRIELFAFWIVYMAVHIAFCINYKIVDIEVYYIQAYIPAAVLAGYFIFRIEEFLKKVARWRSLQWIFVFCCCSWLAIPLIRNYFFCDRNRNFIAYDYAVNVFNSCPMDSVLVTQGWSSPFVFSYLEHVVSFRPDIRVVVDYKGINFIMADRDKWEIPVCTTVAIDIPGLENATFVPWGMVYRFEPGWMPLDDAMPSDIWEYMRRRSLDVSGIVLDFHCKALLAAYFGFSGEFLYATSKREEGLLNLKIAESYGAGNNLVANNLSGIYFKLGEYQEAERLARISVGLDDRFVPAHHNLGNALMKQRRWMEAIQEFKRSNDQLISMGRTHHALGYVYLQKGQFSRALEELEKALKLNPGSRELRLNISTAHINLNNINEAQEILSKLAEEWPDDLDIWNNQALLYLKKDQVTEARKLVEMILNRKPDHLEALANMGLILAMEGHFTEAESVFEKVVQINPEHLPGLNNMALIQYKLGNLTAAKDYWKRSLSLNREQFNILENLRMIGVSESELQEFRMVPKKKTGDEQADMQGYRMH